MMNANRKIETELGFILLLFYGHPTAAIYKFYVFKQIKFPFVPFARLLLELGRYLYCRSCTRIQTHLKKDERLSTTQQIRKTFALIRKQESSVSDFALKVKCIFYGYLFLPIHFVDRYTFEGVNSLLKCRPYKCF